MQWNLTTMQHTIKLDNCTTYYETLQLYNIVWNFTTVALQLCNILEIFTFNKKYGNTLNTLSNVLLILL